MTSTYDSWLAAQESAATGTALPASEAAVAATLTALSGDAADAFTAWLDRRGLLGKIDKAQCTAMADVFLAGYGLGVMRGCAEGPAT